MKWEEAKFKPKLSLFAPRWHGYARWQLEEYEPTSDVTAFLRIIAKGWTRRPRGSEYVRYVATQDWPRDWEYEE